MKSTCGAAFSLDMAQVTFLFDENTVVEEVLLK